MNFSGVFTAIMTPFKSGRVDATSFQKLLKFQIKGGVNGIVVNGTTGESPTLEEAEVRELMICAREVVGKNFPLVLGTGTNSTKKTIELTKQAAKLGANACLVVAPYYNKPPQRGLVKHFQEIADESELPIILYNVPSRTIVALSLESTLILSRHEKIIGVKDATADMSFGEATIKSADKDFFVTSGDDSTYLELALRGGAGAISVISNILPQQTVELFAKAKKGDRSALTDYKKYGELLKALYVESNPIPVKMAAHLMGLIESPELRLPLIELASEHKLSLQKCLKSLDLLS